MPVGTAMLEWLILPVLSRDAQLFALGYFAACLSVAPFLTLFYIVKEVEHEKRK